MVCLLCTIISNLFYAPAVKIIFLPPIYMANTNEYSSKKKTDWFNLTILCLTIKVHTLSWTKWVEIITGLKSLQFTRLPQKKKKKKFLKISNHSHSRKVKRLMDLGETKAIVIFKNWWLDMASAFSWGRFRKPR